MGFCFCAASLVSSCLFFLLDGNDIYFSFSLHVFLRIAWREHNGLGEFTEHRAEHARPLVFQDVITHSITPYEIFIGKRPINSGV